MSTFSAGWYPDYSDSEQQRYYDGAQWTHYVYRRDDGTRSRWRKRKLPKFKPSAQLVEATYRMVFADKSMIVLLFAGSVLAALASAAVLVPATYWGHVTPSFSSGGVPGVLVLALSMGVASFVFQLVSGAVVAAAILRAEGRSATAREALRYAWGRRRQLLAWALLSTVVGVVVRALERMGVGGVIAALTLDIGWAFATVFATPVIMVEGTMPLATVKRSASLLRGRFTVLLISGFTAALPWIVLALGSLGVILVGLGLLFFAPPVGAVIGVVAIAVGAVGFAYSAAVSNAVSAYLETYLYRYAVGLPVPGVDQHLLPPLSPA